MSAKNRDDHNRWRNITVGFRVSPEENEQINIAAVLDELKRIEAGGELRDELLQNIELITRTLYGMKDGTE